MSSATATRQYILYILLAILIYVYIADGSHSNREGYTPPKLQIDAEDSDSVTVIKYMYYFACVIAGAVITLPYQLIMKLLNLPFTLVQTGISTLQPMAATVATNVQSLGSMLDDAFVSVRTTIKDQFSALTNIPQMLKSVAERFFSLAKSIFSGVRSIVSFFQQIGAILLKIPQLLMKVPAKCIQMLTDLMDKIISLLS
jgi:hypothetical protein